MKPKTGSEAGFDSQQETKEATPIQEEFYYMHLDTYFLSKSSVAFPSTFSMPRYANDKLKKIWPFAVSLI
jgi:hypothetical protein